MNAHQLSQEVSYFNERKAELLAAHRGLFVLIKGRELLGPFHNIEEAYKAGLEKFGHVPVLIKQLVDEEPVHHIPALTYGLFRAAL